MSIVALIRDARADEAFALEALQRRASDVWEEYRAQLAAHPDAITPPHQAIAEGRVRVAVDAAGRRLGFSTVLPVHGRRCELDDLFVEPEWMQRGVGRVLADARATPDPHRDTRMVRKLDSGNYLVCHEGDGCVREYDAAGKVVWEYKLDLG